MVSGFTIAIIGIILTVLGIIGINVAVWWQSFVSNKLLGSPGSTWSIEMIILLIISSIVTIIGIIMLIYGFWKYNISAYDPKVEYLFSNSS